MSRLQNAADAAALAGAQALIKNDKAFEDYYIVALASNKLPVDFDDYEDVFANTFEKGISGELKNYKTKDEVKDTLLDGRALVEEYARKNLSDSTEVNTSENNQSKVTATDGWANEKADSAVKGTVELKYKIVDGKNDVYGPLYYVVNLSEKIRHFFLPGWFDDMDAPVRAVVLLRPHDEGLITPVEELERTMIIDNWEYANKYRGTTGEYAGKWNHYMSGNTGDDSGVSYSTGNVYRTESVRVKPVARSGNNESDGQSTKANGNKFYNENEVDSINIDFQAEVRKKFSTDWDLGQPISGYSYSHVEKINGEKSWGIGNGDDKRILFNADFESTFETRDPKKKADILWTRIESDPLKNPYTGAGVTIFNSVRQITLNFNHDNTETYPEGNENAGHYKYRPYFIFYDGPENIDYAKDANGVLIRHSQPVVINLNEDLNAIMYFHESPVIINGNNHAWHGFIVAKCFLQAATGEDVKKGFTFYDGFNKPSKFKGGYVDEGKDSEGNTIYYKKKDLLTKEQIDEKHKDDNVTIDKTTENIIVKELIQTPQYPVISFSKDLYTDCTTLAEYFAKTAEYINAKYTKEKYMAYSGLSESEISMIKFPEENETLINASGAINHNYGNFTAITIPVATADLLDSDPDPNVLTKDNKYVKVMLGETPKYILKSKLPHVRVKWNSEYPYVCLYDLKTGLGWGLENPLVCVKPIDDSLTANDSAIVFTNSKDENVPNSNQWGDVWVIERRIFEDIYKNNYKADKLEFGEKGGVKYFIMPKEPKIVAKYHKVTLANDEVKYLKDGDEDDIQYYTQINSNNKSGVENYIIYDKKGNMLTKALTAPQIFNTDGTAVNTVSANKKLKNTAEATFAAASNAQLIDYWNKYTRYPNGTDKAPNEYVKPEEIPEDEGTTKDDKYIGLTEKVSRLNKDYRIPAFERVYLKSAFNLRYTDKNVDGYDPQKDSFYSYFDIDSLKRVNYLYLNVDEIDKTVNGNPSTDWKVDDMFFTKIRAAWVD